MLAVSCGRRVMQMLSRDSTTSQSRNSILGMQKEKKTSTRTEMCTGRTLHWWLTAHASGAGVNMFTTKLRASFQAMPTWGKHATQDGTLRLKSISSQGRWNTCWLLYLGAAITSVAYQSVLRTQGLDLAGVNWCQVWQIRPEISDLGCLIWGPVFVSILR